MRELERAAAELRERAGARERELDLLAFELAEIEEAAPDAAEEAALLADRERLRHVEALRGAALGAAEAAAPEEGTGAVALLAAGGDAARRAGRRRRRARRARRALARGGAGGARTSPASCAATPRASTATRATAPARPSP